MENTTKGREYIYIMLHSCQTGEHSYNLLEEAFTGISFGQEISKDMPNTIIGAPSSNLQIDAKGEKVIDRDNGKIGTWNFYKNGEKIGDARTGKYEGNPDLIDYNRPNLGGNNSKDSFNLNKFIMDAALAGATINIHN